MKVDTGGRQQSLRGELWKALEEACRVREAIAFVEGEVARLRQLGSVEQWRIGSLEHELATLRTQLRMVADSSNSSLQRQRNSEGTRDD